MVDFLLTAWVTRATFLDEYRIVVSASGSASDVPEFIAFDTSIPCGHPMNSKRFRAPPRYRGWPSTVCVDDVLDRDRPLTADPTQAVFVMKLTNLQSLCVLLIVRAQTLIEHIRSVNTDTCVPWDEWGRDAVVMEASRYDRFNGGPYPLVHGAHMIVAKTSARLEIDGCYHNLLIFDFSRRGWSLLPPCDDGDRVRWTDGGDLLIRGSEFMDEEGFRSLGDGRFMYLVSLPCRCGVVKR